MCLCFYVSFCVCVGVFSVFCRCFFGVCVGVFSVFVSVFVSAVFVAVCYA